ncbi:MAG: Lrp/AsnC ligand binding domain-containing protein [Candidatus Thermoplasmatota archaeon]|nr:Lrp/AsnC ligand binding domain-containing protein [Candidatus Thermoplasmatota archaeon]
MIIRKKYLFYILAFASSIIAAGVSALDTVVTQLYIPDPWALGFACFLVGIPITLILVLFFSIPIKNKSLGAHLIDPSFKRIRLIKKQELSYHLFAGLGNAILTIGYFALLSTIGDPSVVLPFTQIAILYLIVFESFTEKNIPTLIEIQSSLIVTFGAILGAISLSGDLNLESFAIVFIIINPSWMIFSIYQRKLKMLRIHGRPNDSLNIRFWNVVFACMFSVIIVPLADIMLGTSHFQEAINALLDYFPWVALIMSFTFFEFVFYIRALGFGKASVTQAVRATTVVFAIPFSMILISQGLIPPITTNPVLILLKIIGITLVMLGIVSFALALVKAYVFITVKPGYPIEETMQKLWNIRGVTRVTAIAGKYDFIVKIRTRTLVTGYERIIRKINEIEAIKKYQWASVLKDWENI